MWEFQIIEHEMVEFLGFRYPDPVSSFIVTCDDNRFNLTFNKFLENGIMSARFLSHKACMIMGNPIQRGNIEIQNGITILCRDNKYDDCPAIVDALLERLKINEKFLLYAKDRVKKNKQIFVGL